MHQRDRLKRMLPVSGEFDERDRRIDRKPFDKARRGWLKQVNARHWQHCVIYRRDRFAAEADVVITGENPVPMPIIGLMLALCESAVMCLQMLQQLVPRRPRCTLDMTMPNRNRRWPKQEHEKRNLGQA